MMNAVRSDICLSYGANLCWLKPSLRAATTLEKLHGGFPALLRRIEEQDTATIETVILSGATDASAARRLIRDLTDVPLSIVRSVTLAPAFALITALMTPDLDQGEAAKAPTGKPVAWATLYADLYKIATGWLGWTPDTAWSATLPEIMHAFDGHIEQLKAVHGTADDETPGASEMTADQRQANIDAGLDPEFDRAALHALKAKL